MFYDYKFDGGVKGGKNAHRSASNTMIMWATARGGIHRGVNTTCRAKVILLVGAVPINDYYMNGGISVRSEYILGGSDIPLRSMTGGVSIGGVVVIRVPGAINVSMDGGAAFGGRGGAVLTYKIPQYMEGHGSQADYSPVNIAWLIEWFGNMFGLTPDKISFCYAYASGNWVEHFPTIDIEAKHPLDKEYLPDYTEEHTKTSPEQARYEERAKQSVRLMNYENKVGIRYFQ